VIDKQDHAQDEVEGDEGDAIAAHFKIAVDEVV
jgi:hypothetical protein